MEVVVEDTSPVADDVLALRLARGDGGALPAWEPGAHIDLFLGNGLERQYSLCGDPRRNDSWTIAVLHEPRGRGGSHWVRTQVRKGTQLTVRGPRNNFPLVEASRYILIAGGIGITPLLPMAEELARRGADWQLHYGGREAASMAFTERLRPWPDRVRIRPETEYGLLDLDAILGEPHSTTAVYCCGPEGLLEAAQTRCRRWPAGSLHIERFRPRPDARQGEDQDFEVVLDRSGVTLQVSVGESIVDVLESTGIEVDTSCREGTCGTCETTVLDGVPDHRDSFLTEEERNTSETMMICCSRARTARIVLDL
ncbi:PDR/VanB family oxidoreductase [Streptomyces sp. cg40]|uniref:PDR/VanB family oxidoreductase n=1 Tax=Streptomyces sp. cg40 TaxID=3419764 RepID=UPI003D095514